MAARSVGVAEDVGVSRDMVAFAAAQGWACAMLLAVESRDDYDYGWLFGLIDPDPAVRAAALRRREAYRSDWRDALDRCNAAYWANGGSFDFSDAPALGAARDQAQAAMWEARDRGFSGILEEFITESRPFGRRDPTALRRLVPFAVLFLQWEVAYPQDWGSPWPLWGAKKDVLRGLAGIEIPQDSRAVLVELVVAAVRREHRCEDRWFVLLARRLDGPELRNPVARCLDSPDPIVSLRAGFLLDVLADPSMPATVASWKRWLASTAT
jgi:hypothetical protein